MKSQFGMRALLAGVAIVAFFSTLFYYLPGNIAWEILLCAALVAPLCIIPNAKFNALFWIAVAAISCHLLVQLGYYWGEPMYGTLGMPFFWVAIVGFGVRKQTSLFRNVLVTGFITMWIGIQLTEESVIYHPRYFLVPLPLLATTIVTSIVVVVSAIHTRKPAFDQAPPQRLKSTSTSNHLSQF